MVEDKEAVLHFLFHNGKSLSHIPTTNMKEKYKVVTEKNKYLGHWWWNICADVKVVMFTGLQKGDCKLFFSHAINKHCAVKTGH